MHATPSLPSPFFQAPEQRVALARERFFEDGERPRGLVSDCVIQSWERCLGGGLMPQQRPEFEPVTRQRTRRVLDRNRQLLRAAGPACEQLQDSLAGTRCKALLTDRDGIVVHATASGGDAGVLLETAGRVGVFLGEANFGSTAPGIAAESLQPCSVLGGEHFFSLLKPMHCAAAPIRDRHGRLVATLDLSIEGRPFGFDALTVARLTAAAIEQQLFVVQSQGQVLLRLALAPDWVHGPLAALVALDEAGRVAATDGRSMQLLQIDPAARPGDAQALFGAGLGRLLELRRQPQPVPLRLPSGLRVFACVERVGGRAESGADAAGAAEAAAPAAPAAAPVPRPLCSARADLIADALRRHGGNVSRAARELGVSRGLVYRSLQRQPR